MCQVCVIHRCDHDERVRWVAAELASDEWVVQHVDAENRPFAFTIGLTRKGLPELVVTGTDVMTAARLLVPAITAFGDGDFPDPGARWITDDDVMIEAIEVTHPEIHLVLAHDLYGRALRAIQLVHTDESGTWPWEAGHRSASGGLQYLLGPRTDSKSVGGQP